MGITIETTQESEGHETPYEELEMIVKSEGPPAPKENQTRLQRGPNQKKMKNASEICDKH